MKKNTNSKQDIDTSRGERIKKLRESKNLKKVDLAQKIGKTRQAIANYEKGESFTIQTAIVLSEMLEVTLDYLLKGENEDTQKVKNTLNLFKDEIDKLNKLINR